MEGTERGSLDRAARWVWSLGGLGFIPIYHSFWGAIVGLPLYALFMLLGWKAYLIGYVAILALGWLVSARSLSYYGSDKQNPSVIIDKTFGYLTAMFLAPQYYLLKYPFLWGLLIFLALDMLKPWYVGRINQKTGSLFIMLDDFVAGLTACFSLWLVATAHYFILEPRILPAIFAQ
ncbi:MAG: phosphatidylglycerophosphatase A [Deltaproteobacteria bacterium]|jgi:phosphatidylglycerophosphatase A|nr:phosphatidylglycerophosphatase A [Deltaproteobacteria bacterium]